MTTEQILELAKTCGFDEFPDDITATKEQLLKFAQAIHEDGYNEGYSEGYDSSTMSSKMNMWEEE